MSITNGSQITAADFISTSAGAGDSGKAPKLNSGGKLDGSFSKVPTIQTFTSSGTWTKPAGCTWVEVELVGGGSAGANAAATNYTAGYGGGSGGYCKKIVDVTAISTETITIGSGTSFGAIMTGGDASGQTGGSATGGDINVPGQDGTSGVAAGAALGGIGGSNPLGAGGKGAAAGGGDGSSGKGNGSGGGGATGTGSVAGTGGSGTTGKVVVKEHYI